MNEFLQAAGGPPNVFAGGDIAALTRSPRPKAGVFAVREVREWGLGLGMLGMQCRKKG